jgi:hypothetical protein
VLSQLQDGQKQVTATIEKRWTRKRRITASPNENYLPEWGHWNISIKYLYGEEFLPSVHGPLCVNMAHEF